MDTKNTDPAQWFYVGLLHYPVYNQKGDIITTAVTNADIHDLARTCRTYAVRRVFMISPISKQRELMRRIVEHWTLGSGAKSNKLRKEAMDLVKIVPGFEDACAFISKDAGLNPFVIGTSAQWSESSHSARVILQRAEELRRPSLLILGTGWGVVRDLLDSFDERLEPIDGVDGYNHLSVRCAAAILLDRLRGTR